MRRHYFFCVSVVVVVWVALVEAQPDTDAKASRAKQERSVVFIRLSGSLFSLALINCQKLAEWSVSYHGV